ncbi:MAG: hypothetical protein U0931_11055 [Vulcanimicrobiota bacterium]
MIEIVILGVVACGLAIGIQSSRAERARKKEFQAFVARHEWSQTPTHPEVGLLDRSNRGWEFFGQTRQGIDWEVYLLTHDDSPGELCFRAGNLKLPKLELTVGPKTDVSKLKAALPQFESAANTFLGKIAMSMAEKFCLRMGATAGDLLDFHKVAEEKTLGSSDFQSHYTVLTRGTLPIETVLRPEAQKLIDSWCDRQFRLSWGTQGLFFYIEAKNARVFDLCPDVVRLGEILTGA